ncbi:MAG: MBL fold metallo-hydrolase [Thermodesulfobacteriota bacterium]|nr:MBL fold metallo-hydrolase [Thermodesulfobacteriota bacterium]
MMENIFWLGHSGVRIDGEKVIYIDPWKLKNPKEADIVLISHSQVGIRLKGPNECD